MGWNPFGEMGQKSHGYRTVIKKKPVWVNRR